MAKTTFRFPVTVDRDHREAEIRIATEVEVRRLAFWRLPKVLPKDASVAKKIFDAVEFARLASNRWRYYHRGGAAVKSLEGLFEVIRLDPRAEVAMVLIARPTWRSKTPTLGIAYLRRTWCHHLFLEFFATHPHVIAKKHGKVGGVGVGILGQVVSLAESLKVPCIWGEATESSASWYEDQLAVERVLDHFFIKDDVMRHCLDEFHRSQKQMLARRTKT
jgi:hypothetical protein